MTTCTITKEIQFDAGHRVPLHESKCQHPHGHRYRVIAEVHGGVPNDGMVLDFGILKTLMMREIHDPFDHGMILQDTDTDLIQFLDRQGWRVQTMPVAPTAENLAALFFERLVYDLRPDFDLRSVTVWETPTSSATYTKADRDQSWTE